MTRCLRHRVGRRLRGWLSAAIPALLLVALVLPIPAGSSPAQVDQPRPESLQRNEAFRVLGAAEVSMLRDPGGRLGLDEVRQADYAARFESLPRGLSHGYSDDVLWLRIALQRAADAPERWRLELTASLFNDVRFYQTGPGGQVEVLQAGDQFPFAERPVAYRRPVFDLFLPDEDLQFFYIRIRTDSAHLAQIVLWQGTAFDAALQRDTLWIGALLGIVLISVFFFLQAWFLNRDRLLLAAAGVTIVFAIAASANLGLSSQYLFPHHPQWTEGLHPVSMALFFTVLVALFARALDLGSVYPGFYRARHLVAALCFIAAVSRLFGWYAALGGRLMMLGMLFALGWITVAAWLAWWQRRRGLATALALTACNSSFSVAPMIVLGIVPSGQAFELFWVVGSVGFILLAQLTTLEEVRIARRGRFLAERDAVLAHDQAQREAHWRKEQEIYFAGVAHDLRTPLAALFFGISNLRRALEPSPAGIAERMERLQASARRVGDMIERHLQMLRLRQPGFRLERVSTRISDCLSQVSAAVVDACPGCRFEFRREPGVPDEVVFDAELVIRALTNLLANAARVAPSGSSVTLTVVAGPDGGVGFVVRDQGCGVPPEIARNLREMRWHRAVDTASNSPGDIRFGIGLPMVCRIAELHHGRLDYAREPSGVTAFTLWLPPGERPVSDFHA